jgi:hypothetical protein
MLDEMLGEIKKKKLPNLGSLDIPGQTVRKAP